MDRLIRNLGENVMERLDEDAERWFCSVRCRQSRLEPPLLRSRLGYHRRYSVEFCLVSLERLNNTGPSADTNQSVCGRIS